MKLELDSVVAGLVIGLITPILGYGIVSYIFDMLTSAGLMDYVSTSGNVKREKTLWLLGICFNLIPFNVFKSKKYDNTMRGIVFPTLCYVGYWIYTYAWMLFN